MQFLLTSCRFRYVHCHLHSPSSDQDFAELVVDRLQLGWLYVANYLAHFMPLISFNTPWTHLMFSGGYIKRSVAWNGIRIYFDKNANDKTKNSNSNNTTNISKSWVKFSISNTFSDFIQSTSECFPKIIKIIILLAYPSRHLHVQS